MRHHAALAVTATAAVALTALVASTGPTLAASRSQHHPVTPTTSAAGTPRVVATGLNNPRHLAFQGGAMFVAEAGTGGSGPCGPSPEGGTDCFGTSGSIARIHHGQVTRIITGLPSTAGQGTGASAVGPSGVVMLSNHRLAFTVGGGSSPAERASDGPGGAAAGTLVAATRRGRTWSNPRLRQVSDLLAYEAAHDPDGQGVDSDLTGVTVRNGRFFVTDSAGNDLLRTGRGGTSTVAVFANRTVANPFGPGTIPMQSVPTSVARGPRGSLFVSELTGFPFPQGAAQIYRISRQGAVSVYATGLTNLTDLTWARGHLWAIQLSDVGLAHESGLPMGSLVRVDGGSAHQVVSDHLPAPYGVAVQGRSAYVTTCSVCAGGGQVVRIPLG